MLPAILQGQQANVKLYLSNFKDRGIVQYSKTLLIPQTERIPALVEPAGGRFQVVTALCASLKSAFDNLNLRVTVNESQVLEIADAIIDESYEDNLALEDVLLFLGQLITGKLGKLYDRLDMPTFFELFEVYRQERHKSLMNIKHEQDRQFQSLGDANRWSDNPDPEIAANRSAMNDYLKTQYQHEATNGQQV